MQQIVHILLINALYDGIGMVWYGICHTCWYLLENRSEFLEKLERARTSVGSNPPQPVLSTPGSATVNVGNWCLISKKEGELRIVNTDGQQVGYLFCVLLSRLLVYLMPHCIYC